jgi:putative membrane protein
VSEPDLRVLQANERTLLAWVRTGLALMAFGIVVAKLAVWLRLEHPEESRRVSTWLGVGLLGLGVACHAVGALRFVHTRRAIVEGKPIVPTASGPVAIAITTGVLGLAAMVYAIASG